MRALQKLIIVFFLLFTYVNAKEKENKKNEMDLNKKYVEELANYNLKLPKNIANPFVIVKKVKKQKLIKQAKNRVQKRYKKPRKHIFIEKKLYLLAILNNKVFIKFKDMAVGRWLKIGESLGDYTLKRIITNNSVLMSINNKTKIVKIEKQKTCIKVIK